MKIAKNDIKLFANQRAARVDLISLKGTLNSTSTWFDKILLILGNEQNPLTARQILDRCYEYFGPAKSLTDRKNMIAISTILNEKCKKGKLIKVEDYGKVAKFNLISK